MRGFACMDTRSVGDACIRHGVTRCEVWGSVGLDSMRELVDAGADFVGAVLQTGRGSVQTIEKFTLSRHDRGL